MLGMAMPRGYESLTLECLWVEWRHAGYRGTVKRPCNLRSSCERDCAANDANEDHERNTGSAKACLNPSCGTRVARTRAGAAAARLTTRARTCTGALDGGRRSRGGNAGCTGETRRRSGVDARRCRRGLLVQRAIASEGARFGVTARELVPLGHDEG